MTTYNAIEITTIQRPAKSTPIRLGKAQIVQESLRTYTGDLYIAGNKIRMMDGSPAIGSNSSGFGQWASGRCYHGNLSGNLYVQMLDGTVMMLPAGSAVEVPAEVRDNRPGVSYVG